MALSSVRGQRRQRARVSERPDQELHLIGPMVIERMTMLSLMPNFP